MENTTTKEYAVLFTALENAITDLERLKLTLIKAEQTAEDSYVSETENKVLNK